MSLSLLGLLPIALGGDLGLTPYATTDFPVMVGGGLTAALPHRLRVDGSIGLLPGPYWDAVNWGMVTFDVYSQTTADLIDVLLEGALVMRLEGGWQPWEDRGFFFTAGYQHLGLAGGTTTIDQYAEGVDEQIIEAARDEVGELEVTVAPRMVLGRVGWEWSVKQDILLRATLGFAYTVRSTSTVTLPGERATPVGEAAAGALEDAAEVYLDDIFESWVHVPMIGVSAGYTF